MAFTCEACHVTPCFPFSTGFGLSFGPCETCRQMKPCADCRCETKGRVKVEVKVETGRTSCKKPNLSNKPRMKEPEMLTKDKDKDA